jgi:hypothetical protein
VLRKILLGVVAVVTLLVVVVALQPAEFTVERSAHVAAPPDVVHGRIADFHAWPSWSPWQDLDPGQETTFSGAEAGVGAKYHWKSDVVGEGEMEITGAEAPSVVEIALRFIQPFPSQSDVTFRVEEEEGGSKVTWTMHGTNDFLGKAFGLFADFDAMVGPDFEKGLAKLDGVARAEAKRLADEEAAAEAAAQAAAEATAEPAADGAVPQ